MPSSYSLIKWFCHSAIVVHFCSKNFLFSVGFVLKFLLNAKLVPKLSLSIDREDSFVPFMDSEIHFNCFN